MNKSLSRFSDVIKFNTSCIENDIVIFESLDRPSLSKSKTCYVVYKINKQYFLLNFILAIVKRRLPSDHLPA